MGFPFPPFPTWSLVPGSLPWRSVHENCHGNWECASWVMSGLEGRARVEQLAEQKR